MKKRTRHHLIPKARRGELKHKYIAGDFERTLNLWLERHRAWHFLFGNMTIPEIIEVLMRIERIKFPKK